MSVTFQKFIISLIFNSSLFLLLIIGIQNSVNKGRVNLFRNETINFPISFIMGTSFISGSITGSFLSIIYLSKKK